MEINFFEIASNAIPEKGDLLISEPYLPDKNFSRSVIYLCEHDENGTLGYIINKPTTVNLADIVQGYGKFNPFIQIGGPVEKDTLHFIHRDNINITTSKEVSKGVYWPGSFEELKTKANLGMLDLLDFKFFLGYAGWSAGQLQVEIENKSWIVCKQATAHQIFEIPNDNMWSEVLKTMGGKYKMFANYPSDPRMN